MTREEVRNQLRQLARERYPEHAEEEQSMVTFLLLLDVADTYLDELENDDRARDDPAPYLGVTPLRALLNGLEENLEMLREGR